MKNFLYFSLCLFCLASCSKNDKNGLEGSLEGNVELVSVNGQNVPEQRGVRVDATENLMNKGVKASGSTNEYGHYKINDLWSGSYEVTFRKAGFGTVTNSISLLGGDESRFLDATMYEIPDFIFKTCEISLDEEGELQYTYTLNDSLKGEYAINLVLAFSKSSGYSMENIDQNFIWQSVYIFGSKISGGSSVGNALDVARQKFYPEGGEFYVTLCVANGYETGYMNIITSLYPVSNTLKIDL